MPLPKKNKKEIYQPPESIAHAFVCTLYINLNLMMCKTHHGVHPSTHLFGYTYYYEFPR